MVHAGDTATTRTRRRGAALERAIHRATMEELAEAGYAGLTMEGVAKRAQTGKGALYRRWASKRDLVLDSLLRVLPEPQEVALSGSVRDNLIAALTIMADTLAGRGAYPGLGVMGEVLREPELRNAFKSRVIEPRQRLIQAVLQQGADRGEIDPGSVNSLRAQIGPALVIQAFLLTGKPPPESELTQIVDTILMPLIAAGRDKEQG